MSTLKFRQSAATRLPQSRTSNTSSLKVNERNGDVSTAIRGAAPKGSVERRAPSASAYLLCAGIVGRVDVIELHRRLAVNLNHSFPRCASVVVHARVQIGKAAGRKLHRLAVIPLISHANFQRSRNHCHVFSQWMGVGSDFVSIWHLQANGVISRRSHGIAFEHGQLCSRWDKRRSRSPFHLIWRKGVLRPQRCGEKRADRKNNDEKR